jgi:hypothetical protein
VHVGGLHKRSDAPVGRALTRKSLPMSMISSVITRTDPVMRQRDLRWPVGLRVAYYQVWAMWAQLSAVRCATARRVRLAIAATATGTGASVSFAVLS